MSGIVAGRFIQLGQEGTAGTEVDATAIYRGLATFTDETEVVFPEENVGYLSGLDRTYIPKVGGIAEFDEHELTFEQILYWLDAGVDAVAGVSNGGDPYFYTYVMPELATDSQAVKTYTLELGDNQQEEQMLGCFVEEFTLSGAPDEAVKISGTWRGRQIAPGTRTAGLTPSTVEEVLFNKGKLYIGTGASYGTQEASTWVGFDMNVKTGWMLQPTGDGNLYASLLKQTGPEVTIDIVMEHNAISVAEVAAWRAQTHRKVYLEFTGSAFGTPGSTYTNKLLGIEIDGKWESFSGMDDMDGDNTLTGTLRARFNSTSEDFVSFLVVNASASFTPSASASPSASTSPSSSVSPSLSPSASASPSGA